MMKVKIASIILLSVVAFIATSNNHVSAQSIPYTFAYNATNLYTDDVVQYEFSGLDNTRSYKWDLWTVDMETGEPDDFIGFKTLGPGVTTGSWFFGVAVSGVNDGQWPTNYLGPIYVIDSFGNTIGNHFVHPKPLLADGTDVWEQAGGTFPVGDRLVIGNTNINNVSTASGNCKSVIFNDFNPAGFLHAFNACQSTTTLGDIAIWHFQYDPVGYSPARTDAMSLVSMSTGTGSDISLAVTLNDIFSYQVRNYSAGATFTAFYSFLVINTSGEELPYVNYQLADTAFGPDSLTNPYRWGSEVGATFNDQGAYTCYKEIAATPVSDCESVWLVSNDPTPQQYQATEWDIEPNSMVEEGGSQRIRLLQNTPQIWDSYSGGMSLIDLYSSFTDTTIYAFAAERTQSYTVNSTAADNRLVAWTVEPRFMYSGAVAVTTSDMDFVTFDTYDITLVTSIEEAIDEVISNTGLDTELGRTALHVAVILFGLITVAFIPGARSNFFAYLIAWTAVGGLWAVAGFSTDIGTLFWFILTAFLWVMALAVYGNEARMGGSTSEY